MKWQILGIHSQDARVRMFIGDKEVDEDFPLPELYPGVPRTTEVYSAFLASAIDKRVEELEKSA